MMKKSLGLVAAAGALALTALAGCADSPSPETGSATSASSTAGTSASAPASSGSTGTSTTSSAPGAAASADLKTGSTSLGTVLVNADGRTVYYYDKDVPNSGKSTCSGNCLALWPAVVASSETPAVEGVTGEVGAITRDDGSLQVTVNGLPVYLYTPDTKAGDVTGQGVGGIWWVVAPDGAKVTGSASGY